MKTKSILLSSVIAIATTLFTAAPVSAGGTLTPVESSHAPIQIRTHQVNVTINNGFAQTEVLQTFFNPNPNDIEAVYSFPVPTGASLSEISINNGEKILNGEVLPRAEAQTVYEEEKAAGNDAGLGSKHSYQSFEFKVTPVRAGAEAHLRFVYYQPLEIDTGMGRYVYPLEEGGTDEVAQSFWSSNDQVEGELRFNVELKSAVPVDALRVPGFENVATIQNLDTGHHRVTLSQPGARLNRDFVLYYRLADNLPGRVEVIPYRAAADQPGTFMMVVTPGVDLQPLNQGADYAFVLDTSGSMQGKIHTLAEGVSQGLGQMSAQDRFRIIEFGNRAKEVMGWTAATPAAVQAAVERVKALQPRGGTNIYEGLELGLRGLDADRATSVVLVTDGVTNQGIVEPAKFHQLVSQYDIRIFGFLMGNSANWPLMRTIADATGGFYAGVSNADDIVGQILLAKSKITHEAMHDASFKFSGARVFDTTGDNPKKIYRGQQQVIFGRYEKSGPATVKLHARLTGEDKVYTTDFVFPEVDTDNPEIERLWAMAQIEQIELKANTGQMPVSESDDAITHLGVHYQIVTDHTSMVVLDDETFARRGIDRRNQQRVGLERTAQSARAAQPVKSYRVDTAQPTYTQPAPHVSHQGGGGGGGALERQDVVMLTFIALLLWATKLSRNAMKRTKRQG
ncbi:VIT and vWA domain-containing protein [Synoicihabitans lomoniglobus]|uniref:VIT and VWA domain-containing protein n=1 Tax=Synoicihabitans lomoniglobus TaxID=2909285 RepID=A0AAF0CLV6_9BACT|nr:VIT and VWA domain-containing protein [Opitutaceae bacterium LMO-M01]WED63273.1 VIT and VWA domain-containing protein [Opitutaceae bacterium LMO-M01]